MVSLSLGLVCLSGHSTCHCRPSSLGTTFLFRCSFRYELFRCSFRYLFVPLHELETCGSHSLVARCSVCSVVRYDSRTLRSTATSSNGCGRYVLITRIYFQPAEPR